MTESHPTPSNHPHPATVKALLVIGQVMLFGSLALFVVMAKLYPEPYIHVWALIAAHFGGGRMANAGIGLEMGFNKIFLLYQTCVQDYILMFFAFPFFVKGQKYFSKMRGIGSSLEAAHQLALSHRAKIRPYGIAGLLLFVVFPFWGTGPLVGVIAGYLLGFSTILNFATVMAGNFIAAYVYIWAYDAVRVRVESYGDHLSMVLLVAVIAVIAIAALIARIQTSRAPAAPPPGGEDDAN